MSEDSPAGTARDRMAVFYAHVPSHQAGWDKLPVPEGEHRHAFYEAAYDCPGNHNDVILRVAEDGTSYGAVTG
jgi:hypothetical protein